MTLFFYITAAVALLATLLVVTGRHAVHSLLWLVVSFFALAVLMYLMGAPFAAALEVIVYAGAIMVLFVFVIMMLNVGAEDSKREHQWLKPGTWVGPAVASAILLSQWLWVLRQGGSASATSNLISAHEVGVALFSRYLLTVEMAGLLLLAALVGAFQLGRKRREDNQ